MLSDKRSMRPIPERLAQVSEWICREISPPPEGSAYLVGGLVRDLVHLPAGPPLLHDLDLCLEGSVLSWAEEMANHCGTTVKWEPRFGTARLFFSTGNATLHLDIAMARSERYLSGGSLPVVSPASIAEDLKRRDFSINAMACPLVWSGKKPIGLMDPFGGFEDLISGSLRILHANSFRDDPTRLLRGIRFLVRFDLSWHPDTFPSVQEAVFRGTLLSISPYRIRREFCRIFQEKSPVAVLKEVYVTGLMDVLIPGAHWSETLERQLSRLTTFLEDDCSRERTGFGVPEWDALKELCKGETLFYLVLFGQIPTKVLDQAINRFGLEGNAGRLLSGALRGSERSSGSPSGGRLGKIKIFLEKLATLLNGSSAGEAGLIGVCFDPDLLVQTEKTGLQKLLTGEDLIMLGVTPGRRLGEMLADFSAETEKGAISSRKEALEWAMNAVRRFWPSS